MFDLCLSTHAINAIRHEFAFSCLSAASEAYCACHFHPLRGGAADAWQASASVTYLEIPPRHKLCALGLVVRESKRNRLNGTRPRESVCALSQMESNLGFLIDGSPKSLSRTLAGEMNH
jgi:hypothetical protein